MSEVNKVCTSCKHCVFAVNRDVNGRPTQEDCRLGRVETFGRRGELVEAYDEDADFYVVDGRNCAAYRDVRSDWARRTPQPEEAVRRELTLRAAAVVLVGDASVEDVLATARSLNAQLLPPAEVFFVRSRGESPYRLHLALREACAPHLTWRMVSLYEPDASDGFCVDEAVAQTRLSQWYGVFRAGFVVPDSYFLDIDRALNERLERFCVLLPVASGDGLFVSVAAHRHPLVSGNRPWTGEDGRTLSTLVDKLAHDAELLGQTHMLKSVGSVVAALAGGAQ